MGPLRPESDRRFWVDHGLWRGCGASSPAPMWCSRGGWRSLSGDVSAVDPFRITVPWTEVVELRRRLARTRWPDRQTVSDWSQGVPLQVLREFCSYWETSYDWSATERRLNKLPQFTTEIDGLQ